MLNQLVEDNDVEPRAFMQQVFKGRTYEQSSEPGFCRFNSFAGYVYPFYVKAITVQRISQISHPTPDIQHFQLSSRALP
ncbi:MAG: hypothetical protein A2X30_00180 [Elusimicrobia bacterium GWB2_63_16]|nr:MAG: hypothetical protein A2X30_00180 [Elusimicrobia bacterium GWB2_63_16]